jgi:hypothetical protein
MGSLVRIVRKLQGCNIYKLSLLKNLKLILWLQANSDQCTKRTNLDLTVIVD